MSKQKVTRLLRAFQPSICASCRSKIRSPPSLIRPFSGTAATLAGDRPFLDPLADLQNIANGLQKSSSSFGDYSSLIPQMQDSDSQDGDLSSVEGAAKSTLHHLHIYATKHNTHITLTKPDRGALISVSCGNIGFRKAGRGTYDAAYQLAAYVMSRIQDKGLLADIRQLQVVFRGFGPGRQAVTKAILGSEGRNIRDKIVMLSDATRLKFGGTRSPAPRRLG